MDNDLIRRSRLLKELDNTEIYDRYSAKVLICAQPTEEQEIFISAGEYNIFLEGYKQGKKDFARPQGEWEENSLGIMLCSVCGSYDIQYREHKFCPNCGAKMT